MTPLKLTYRHILILSGGILLSGCSLDEDFHTQQYESNVKVVMNWEDTDGKRPEGMSVLFYPVDGGNYWRFELPNDGGVISLPAGTYHVLSYNNDTSGIIFENTDDYKHTFATSLSSPDELWCANTHTFKRQMPSQTLTVYIKKILSKYTVNVTNVRNSESCYMAEFTISGMASGIYLSTMELLPSTTNTSGRLPQINDNSFSGATSGFGRKETEGECHLQLSFSLRDGSEKKYEYDVTNQIDNAQDPRDVVINISDEIDLPLIETSTPESGLDVGLDEWETIDIDLSQPSGR